MAGTKNVPASISQINCNKKRADVGIRPTFMMPHRSYKRLERVYDIHHTPFPVKLRFALRLCGNFLLIGSNGDTQCGQRD